MQCIVKQEFHQAVQIRAQSWSACKWLGQVTAFAHESTTVELESDRDWTTTGISLRTLRASQRPVTISPRRNRHSAQYHILQVPRRGGNTVPLCRASSKKTNVDSSRESGRNKRYLRQSWKWSTFFPTIQPLG